MERRIAILFFSGTGNTEAVACMLRDELAAGAEVDTLRIEDVLCGCADFLPERYGAFGIGFPSYGFNAPSIVKDFVKRLPCGSAGVFLFTTCAGPCYLNDIAGYGLKRLLKRRGYTVTYETVICMPANILIHYDDTLSRQLIDAARRRARTMAASILEGRACVRNDGVGAAIVRGLYAWCEALMLPLLALDFHVKKTCTQCMICVIHCPKGNIRQIKNRVRFGTHCAGCYRCVYHCSRRAIAGRLFGAAILKNGYDIRRIMDDDTIAGDYVTERTRGLFSTLYQYLKDS